MIEDRELVSRILGGNPEAFRMLIRQNERLVAHMVGRLVKDHDDREELCQDIFLKVYEKLSEFSFQSKLSTWIGTIAYRHAINHLRKHKVLSTDLSEVELSKVESSESPSEELEERDVEEYVHQLIDTLPPQYKLVLTLYHLDQKNYSEIGEITGMPEGTVKNYIFRARQLLKEKIKVYFGKEEVL